MKVRWIAITLLGFYTNAIAYDPVTHVTASENAALASVLADTSYLARIGLKAEPIVSDIYNTFYSSQAEQLSIVELIKFGAKWEDTRGKYQGKYHFFNPLTGKGKTQLGIEIGAPSPSWALEDNAQFADQPFSYRKARQYFLNALTSGARSDRDSNWGLTFQTLGHVIHHVQDMAQPQHTRDDAHCDILPCALTGAAGFSKTNIETWTKDNAPPEFFQGYAPVFWIGGGKGVAEFSNRNFFTAGTNADTTTFEAPKLSGGPGQKIDDGRSLL